jgi:hypothetical protein
MLFTFCVFPLLPGPFWEYMSLTSVELSDRFGTSLLLRMSGKLSEVECKKIVENTKYK